LFHLTEIHMIRPCRLMSRKQPKIITVISLNLY